MTVSIEDGASDGWVFEYVRRAARAARDETVVIGAVAGVAEIERL